MLFRVDITFKVIGACSWSFVVTEAHILLGISEHGASSGLCGGQIVI